MASLSDIIELGSSLANSIDEVAVLPLCEAIGRPPDQIRIFLIFLLQYPFGWMFHYFVHGTTVRHVYNIVLGILIQMYLYGFGICHVVLMTVVAYAMMLLMPRHKSAPCVMLWVLAYLSYSHLTALIYNFGSYEMDVTSYTMLLVCKLSALAYCYQDGATDTEKLNDDQRRRMVVNLPSVLELASYVWYANAAALGVFFEFSDYKRFIERTHEYKDVPSPILPSLKWLAVSLGCLGLFIATSPYFYIELCWHEDFLQYSFPYRIFYYYVAMTFKRFFYYNPFCMTTGAIIASGLGYNGKEKDEDDWNKIVSVYIYECETSSSAMDMFKYWNHQVHLWLKFYIMGRMVKPGKRPGAFENMMTFLVSAFWHGFYPFYYVMFFFAGVLSEVSKDVYKSRRLFSFIPASLRPFLAHFASMLCMNYYGIWMSALTFEHGFAFMWATWGLVPVSLTVFLAYSRTTGLVRKAQKLEAKDKEREAAGVEMTKVAQDPATVKKDQ